MEIFRDGALGLGDDVVTAVELQPRGRRDSGVTRGWFDRRTREIVVITGETSRAQIFKTFVHDIAHAILHGNEDHHARSAMEVEAESVAFLSATSWVSTAESTPSPTSPPGPTKRTLKAWS